MAHKDYNDKNMLPYDWMTNPPETLTEDLCCDAIIGIYIYIVFTSLF